MKQEHKIKTKLLKREALGMKLNGKEFCQRINYNKAKENPVKFAVSDFIEGFTKVKKTG